MRTIFKRTTFFLLVLCTMHITQANAAYTMQDIRNGISADTNEAVTISLNYNVRTCNPEEQVTSPDDTQTQCYNLLFIGFGTNNFSCITQSSTINSPDLLTLTVNAPATAGTYNVWVANRGARSAIDCNELSYNDLADDEIAVINTAGLTVTAPPPPPPAHLAEWSWGYIDTLSINDSAATKEIKDYSVAASSGVKFNFPYYGNPAQAGCPGCIWQIVIGITGGSKYCVISTTGARSGTSTRTLTAPSAAGTYTIWAKDKWAYTCEDAVNNSSSGITIGTVTVKPPTPKGSYGCSCNTCGYTSGSNFSCQCKKANGQWVSSSVDASKYNYALSNSDGRLVGDDKNYCSGYVY